MGDPHIAALVDVPRSNPEVGRSGNEESSNQITPGPLDCPERLLPAYGQGALIVENTIERLTVFVLRSAGRMVLLPPLSGARMGKIEAARRREDPR